MKSFRRFYRYDSGPKPLVPLVLPPVTVQAITERRKILKVGLLVFCLIPAAYMLLPLSFSASLPDADDRLTDSEAIPRECHFLSQYSLSAHYVHQNNGSVRCQSLVRYFGTQNQHSLRYQVLDRQIQGLEMRLSLRIGRGERLMGINRLIRFGQSLALPLLGHTLPAEVGQYLKAGHVGHWDFHRASLYIERHRFPQRIDRKQTPAIAGHEDIELVFRRKL